VSVLTELEQALAHAHGLAIAAATVMARVEERLPSDTTLAAELRAMREEADDTRARCLALEQRRGAERAEELLAHVNTVKERASDLANAWFKAGTGPLAAWSFLAMGEAAEVAVWRALRVLAEKGGDDPVLELADWALPIQERHLEVALDGAVQLAERRVPSAPRWG
jgi:hypothetical protein